MKRSIEGHERGGREMHVVNRGEKIGVEDIYVEMTSSS